MFRRARVSTVSILSGLVLFAGTTARAGLAERRLDVLRAIDARFMTMHAAQAAPGTALEMRHGYHERDYWDKAAAARDRQRAHQVDT